MNSEALLWSIVVLTEIPFWLQMVNNEVCGDVDQYGVGNVDVGSEVHGNYKQLGAGNVVS